MWSCDHTSCNFWFKPGFWKHFVFVFGFYNSLLKLRHVTIHKSIQYRISTLRGTGHSFYLSSSTTSKQISHIWQAVGNAELAEELSLNLTSFLLCSPSVSGWWIGFSLLGMLATANNGEPRLGFSYCGFRRKHIVFHILKFTVPFDPFGEFLMRMFRITYKLSNKNDQDYRVLEICCLEMLYQNVYALFGFVSSLLLNWQKCWM